MQSRSSNSQSRLILIGCLAILLITGVLYFMKRLEASRLSSELSATKVEKREKEDDLNGKLTDYLQKMEEMTKQLGNIQSKLSSCEKEKESMTMEVDEAKNAVEECHTQQTQHVQRQGVMEDELNTLRGECDKDKDKVKEHLATVMQLQQAAKDSEIELDSCQTTSTQCQSRVSSLQAELVQARARCDQQQPSLQNRPVGNVVNPPIGGGNSINPGVNYRQKVSQLGQYQPPNRFVNQQPPQPLPNPSNQQPPNQRQGSPPKDPEEKEPYYPEEKEGEEDGQGGLLNDKHDDIMKDEDQENAPNDKEQDNFAVEDGGKVLVLEKELSNEDDEDVGGLGEV